MPRPATTDTARSPRAFLRSRSVRWSAVALWAAAIFGASSLQGSQVPGGFNTPAHFIEYVVLGGLLYAALRLDRPLVASAVLAVVIASAYAVTDEFHQAFVPGRVSDPLDWAVDTAGAALAVVVLVVLDRRRTQRQ